MANPPDPQPTDRPQTRRFNSDEWFAKAREAALTAYQKERSKGKHDSCCEWDLDFRMCHCHRRMRLTEGKTEAPTLVFMPPNCSECWDSCTHDGDGWYCPDCHVYFGDRYDQPGEWQDEHAATDAELLEQRVKALSRAVSS